MEYKKFLAFLYSSEKIFKKFEIRCDRNVKVFDAYCERFINKNKIESITF